MKKRKKVQEPNAYRLRMIYAVILTILLFVMGCFLIGCISFQNKSEVGENRTDETFNQSAPNEEEILKESSDTTYSLNQTLRS